MSSTLFYVHDPMCSWCYAFQAGLTALKARLPPSIRIKKLVGGLAPDTTELMSPDMRNKIQQTWRRIEQTVPHVRFNHDFWTMNTPIRSTYPACRAVLAAARQGSDYEDNLIRAIQNASYQQAKNPSLSAVLLECAAEAGVDIGTFASELASVGIETELQDQISLSRRLGANVFPALRLQHDGIISPITVDYLDYLTMFDEIERRVGSAFRS